MIGHFLAFLNNNCRTSAQRNQTRRLSMANRQRTRTGAFYLLILISKCICLFIYIANPFINCAVLALKCHIMLVKHISHFCSEFSMHLFGLVAFESIDGKCRKRMAAHKSATPLSLRNCANWTRLWRCEMRAAKPFLLRGLTALFISHTISRSEKQESMETKESHGSPHCLQDHCDEHFTLSKGAICELKKHFLSWSQTTPFPEIRSSG